jgi:hypothetical protein
VVAKTDIVNEVGLRLGNLLCTAPRINTDQQGNQPRHDRRIAVGAYDDAVGVTLQVQPDLRLATGEQLVVGFFLLGQRL